MSDSSATKVTTDSPLMYKAGSVIFGQGQNSKYLYLLKKGQVRLLKVNGQKLSIIQVCNEQDILNEVSVLTNQPTEYAAIAKSDVELVIVDHKDVQAIMKSGPEWIPEIFETLCERLKHTQDFIEEHQLLSGEKDPNFVLSKEDERKYFQAILDNGNR
jgi:CRP-like cAMP-binding protein